MDGTVPGSELIIYQDTADAGADHHAGAMFWGNDGKFYFTTGDEVNVPGDSQNLTNPRGKVMRVNPDGTVPTDNPFYDGSGPNYDADSVTPRRARRSLRSSRALASRLESVPSLRRSLPAASLRASPSRQQRMNGSR